VVDDAFSRTVAGGWGSAPIGGLYTLLGGSASDYAVDGGAGTLLVGSAGSVSRNAILSGVTARDVDLRVRVKTDKAATGSGPLWYVVARRVSHGQEYRGRLRVSSSGKVMVQAARVTNGSEVLLGTEGASGVSHRADEYVQVRMQISGAAPTTIRLKAWADGQAEPSGWQYSVTDSEAGLQTAGALGLRAYLSSSVTNAPVRFSFDDFSAVSLMDISTASFGTTGAQATVDGQEIVANDPDGLLESRIWLPLTMSR